MLGVALALALAVPAVMSAQTLDGKWESVNYVSGQQVRIELVMLAGQRYSETVVSGPYRTLQSGTYVFNGNVLMRSVQDFAPRKQWIVDVVADPYSPTGNRLGGHWQDLTTPPGGRFQVTITSADTMFWKDLDFGGSITFHRIP
jgi:hypothetical protein